MPRAPPDAVEVPSSKPRFDLTTPAGLAIVAAFLVRGGTSLAAITPAAPIAIPIVALLAFYELQKRRRQATTTTAPRKSVTAPLLVRKEQQAVAVAILEKGRELGLSEVEIVLEQDGGVDMGARLPKALNIDLRLKVGRTTRTTIRAKYRDV